MCRSRIYKSKDVELFFNEIHRFDELFHFGLQVRSIFRLDVKISKSSMNRLLRKVYKSLDLTFRFAKFPGYVHSVHFCALRISPERVKTHDILLQIMVAIAVNEHRYFCSFGISCDPPLPLLVLSFLFIFYFALLFFFPLALYTHQSFHPSVCSFCFLSLSLSLSLPRYHWPCFRCMVIHSLQPFLLAILFLPSSFTLAPLSLSAVFDHCQWNTPACAHRRVHSARSHRPL